VSTAKAARKPRSARLQKSTRSPGIAGVSRLKRRRGQLFGISCGARRVQPRRKTLHQTPANIAHTCVSITSPQAIVAKICVPQTKTPVPRGMRYFYRERLSASLACHAGLSRHSAFGATAEALAKAETLEHSAAQAAEPLNPKCLLFVF